MKSVRDTKTTSARHKKRRVEHLYCAPLICLSLSLFSRESCICAGSEEEQYIKTHSSSSSLIPTLRSEKRDNAYGCPSALELNPRVNKPRIFCFHGATKNAFLRSSSLSLMCGRLKRKTDASIWPGLILYVLCF